ncbi:cytochrome C oxidase subunit IV family protein [Mucilaginibacter sp.]
MSTDTHNIPEDHAEHDTMNKKRIWRVFWILVAITTVEFIIALLLVPRHILPINMANPVYIVLTLFKAFYIVAYFMHLKFEKVGMAYVILIPIIFIIGLILVLTNESHHWLDMRG